MPAKPTIKHTSLNLSPGMQALLATHPESGMGYQNVLVTMKAVVYGTLLVMPLPLDIHCITVLGANGDSVTYTPDALEEGDDHAKS